MAQKGQRFKKYSKAIKEMAVKDYLQGKGRKTTQKERAEIVEFCIRNNREIKKLTMFRQHNIYIKQTEVFLITLPSVYLVVWI